MKAMSTALRLLVVVLVLAVIPAGEPARAAAPSESSRELAALTGRRAESYRLFLEGVTLAADGRLAPARQRFEELLVLDPEAVLVRGRLARLCLRQGDLSCAEDEARRALARGGKCGEAHRVLAEMSLQRYGSAHEAASLETALEHLRAATEEEPDDPWAWSVWTRVLALEGRLDEAEGVARRAAAIPSIDPAAPWLVLARVLLAKGRQQETIEILDRVDVQGRSAGAVFELLADLQGSTGDLEGQEKTLEKLLKMRPDRVELAQRLGRVRLERGDPYGAVDALRLALATRESDPALRQDLAQALVRLGQGGEADELLAGIPDAYRSPRTYLLWARAAAQIGHHEKAAERLEMLQSRLSGAEKDSFGPALHLRAAEHWLAAGRPDACLKELENLDSPRDGLRLRLEALDAKGDRAGAEKTLADLMRAAPEDMALVALAAERRQRLASPAAAEEALSRLPSAPSAREQAAARLALALTGLGQGALAEKVLDGIPAPAAPSVAWLRARASAAFATGKLDRAEADYRRILADNPRDDGALNDLGYLLAQSGRSLEEAVSLCRKAVDIKPNQAAYLDSLAWALHRSGKSEQALPLLRRALQSAGDRAQAEMREHMGDIYSAVGDPDRAVAEWQAALVFGSRDGELLREKIRQVKSR